LGLRALPCCSEEDPVIACGLLVALLTACIVTRDFAAPMLARSDSVSATPLVDVVPAAGNIGQHTLNRLT
jgi:hypothetical protein